ncbi:hypothetical protein OG788_33330 [Streptomyces sp. NBC_00647]|uniref:hypothetical protein n=1 Tax=Streptomyces sp. NBC_00647 TaxID=2975796 RepID=UPI00324D2A7F
MVGDPYSEMRQRYWERGIALPEDCKTPEKWEAVYRTYGTKSEIVDQLPPVGRWSFETFTAYLLYREVRGEIRKGGGPGDAAVDLIYDELWEEDGQENRH